MLTLFPTGMVTDVDMHPHSGCLSFLFPVLFNEILAFTFSTYQVAMYHFENGDH